jgi:hypothetical protein
MPRQAPTLISAATGPRSSAELLTLLNEERGYINDHDAMHWPFVLSAPALSDLTFTPDTGGSLTANSTHYVRVAYGTPNGSTKGSSEQAVVLGAANNAFTVTFPATDAGMVPTARIFKAIDGAASGQPTYQAASSHLQLVSGTGASIAADGTITLSTSTPTVVLVIAAPPNTQPVAPTTNSSGAIDPLFPDDVPEPSSQTVSSDGTTYTVTKGNTTAIWTYAGQYPTALQVKRAGITVARYSFTFNSDGSYSMVQMEA